MKAALLFVSWYFWLMTVPAESMVGADPVAGSRAGEAAETAVLPALPTHNEPAEGSLLYLCAGPILNRRESVEVLINSL